MPSASGLVIAGFVAGAAVASGAWLVLGPKTTPAPPRVEQAAVADDDGEALREANANLTESLQECDRRLAEHRAPETAGSAARAPSEARAGRDRDRDRDGGRGRRRAGGEPTREDWERMAQSGTVRVRVPCIRDTPWAPSPRVLDRLGLAPGDAQTLRDAYERSNKRIMAQVEPLCAKVLGSADAAEKVGASSCIDAISKTARRTSPDATRASLTRVAETQAGKRGAPAAGADVPPIEQLASALAAESKAFEDDLAQKLGPEDAKRVAWAPELCADRRTLRASDEREER